MVPCCGGLPHFSRLIVSLERIVNAKCNVYKAMEQDFFFPPVHTVMGQWFSVGFLGVCS